jgi:uncharacterized RDD family membrane protein YckC
MLTTDTLLDQLKEHPIADYASPAVRAIAAAIDLGSLTALQFLAAAILAGALGYHTSYNTDTGAETTYFVFSPLLIIALALAYFPGLWAWRGSTPGMRLFGLRIVNEKDSTRIDRRTALGRFGALLLAIAPALLGLLVAFGDQRRQALHDRLAGTVVVAE